MQRLLRGQSHTLTFSHLLAPIVGHQGSLLQKQVVACPLLPQG